MYCGFYSKIPEAGCGFRDFVDAVCSETAFRKDEILASCSAAGGADTLYIGGGTPSVLPLSELRRIVEAVVEVVYGEERRDDCGELFSEFTVEVNPDDIVAKGAEYVAGLRELGVNRISMGVQSLDDRVLKWMNRRHTVSAAREAYRIIRSAGIDNVSIDLIFGYHLAVLASALESWRATVHAALDIAGDGILPAHISAYQLSIDPESVLADMVSEGKYIEASEELCSAEYEILCEILAEAGYRHYEISNFALPGCEARHNSAYWSGVPYVGIGPAAHSFTGSARRWNISDVNAYIAAARSGDWSGIVSSETLDESQKREEKIMLSMRTDRGISRCYLESDASARAIVEKFLHSGALVPVPRETLEYYNLPLDEPRLRIPEDRFFVSDDIISSF